MIQIPGKVQIVRRQKILPHQRVMAGIDRDRQPRAGSRTDVARLARLAGWRGDQAGPMLLLREIREVGAAFRLHP